MQSLKGKNALITGAGKGLGKAMALALAAEGVNLALLARTEEDLKALAQEIAAIDKDVKVVYQTADVSSYEEVQSAVAKLIGALGTLDVVINNAGIVDVGSFTEMPVEKWEKVIRTNVLGAYYVVHETLPALLANGKGDVVNIASTAGLKGSANLSAYSASKAALISLSESLMYEVRKSNIRVLTVNPSTVATDMILEKKFTDGNPERVLQPEDLAELVVSSLKLPQRALIKEIALWSTNP